MSDTLNPCPHCGVSAYDPESMVMSAPLLAVCDVLVYRVLEVAGKRIVRSERSRFNRLGGKPMYMAHTLWRLDPNQVPKFLKNAWDVIPAMLDVHGCCGVTATQVTGMLDSYTADLLVTGTAHELHQLTYRFERDLDIHVLPIKMHTV